eukprot:TRINITY_DN84184_c0_g1_i1.p1 TRINITY_DN84184_c0_g1~~TRINITY_DN84184_c0_g1_i1.p1  ORF type:complete len:163 (-),score=13.72 TRINITY_DN84184_c0_g1_i1:170-658(-)
MSFLVLSTEHGNIKIKLRPDAAPKTCETISKLATEGHYNGCVIYRAEPGFVIQGGMHGPGVRKESPYGKLPLEYNLPNKKGTVTMARWDEPDTATSEWFINLNDNKNLDKTGTSGWTLGFTVFGEVVEGFDIAEKISKLPTKTSGGLKMLENAITFNASITN